MRQLKKGFTLIELIIVIAILGVLAVALIGALNPIEQVQRGQDAGRQATSKAIIDSINRFYASNQFMPWCPDSVAGSSCDDLNTSAVAVDSLIWCGGTTCPNPPTTTTAQGRLEIANELKGNYLNTIGTTGTNIFVSTTDRPAKTQNITHVRVCYTVTSNAAKLAAIGGAAVAANSHLYSDTSGTAAIIVTNTTPSYACLN